jgi:signal transduction histidine kinase/ActR/RegA family two-component response regulator
MNADLPWTAEDIVKANDQSKNIIASSGEPTAPLSDGPRQKAFTIVIIYLVAGSLWIALSDRFVESLALSPESLTRLQTAKGWLFVALTSTVLYVSLKATFIRISVVDRLLRKAVALAKESAEEATAANQSKSIFLANMSHEIRTPIGAIQGFTDLLLESHHALDEEREWLLTIRRNTEQLTRLIDDILDISKIEADRFHIERTRFSLTELLNDLFAAMSLKAQKKGIRLEVSGTNGLPEWVEGDALRLKQVFNNIIGNAIKFTAKGHVDVTLTTSPPGPDSRKRRLEILVRDTGIGLSPDQQRILFQPFVQADSSTSRYFGGTGLGLYLAKRLAQSLGGDLVLVESQPRKGTTFRATLPIDVADSPVQIPALTEVENLVSEPSASRAKRLEHVKILLVEDSLDNQKFLTRMLANEGATVDTADNGSIGVSKALEKDFDLILMDIQMPGVDGHEAVRRLRAQKYAHPIVALTAHAMKEERTRSLSGGFDGFLTKPISRETLVMEIENLLAARRVSMGFEPAQQPGRT